MTAPPPQLAPKSAPKPTPNSRARDRLGRPLRAGADPSEIVLGVPQRSEVDGTQAWQEAIAYLADGLPFHAHETLEQRWRCCPSAERTAWRALAQWAAALTHAERGNAVGARRIAQRAEDGLRECASLPAEVNEAMVRASLAALMGRVDGPGETSPGQA